MHELLTTCETAEADRLAVEIGVPSLTLMEQAGAAVADLAVTMLPRSGRVIVLAGPGSNGGDGYVAARLLTKRGHNVRVLRVGRAPDKGDAAIMASRWAGRIDAATPEAVGDCDLLIDAIFGSGLNRPIEREASVVIAAVTRSGIPVLAVDLPSGISGDSGAALGEAICATATVTFFRRKPGHLLLPGRAHCGLVTVADIGISRSVFSTIAPRFSANEPSLWRGMFPLLKADGHKYQRGHAVVISGGFITSSAARLSARAALRAGAGLVTLATPRGALLVNAASSLSVMVRQADGAKQLATLLADPRITAVIAGPGAGVSVKTAWSVLAILKGKTGAVLDADALTSFERKPKRLFEAISRRKAPVILTPHDGEFERLFCRLAKIAKLHSKLEKAVAAASVSSAIVIYKGADTVIAAPDGRAAINANARLGWRPLGRAMCWPA